MELKKLDWKIFLFALFFLAFVSFIIISVTYYPWMGKLYELAYSSKVENEYGMTLKKTNIEWPTFNKRFDTLIIDSIKPGSKAEKLGFKAGDIPVDYSGWPSARGLSSKGYLYRQLCHISKSYDGRWPWILVVNKEELDKDYVKQIRKISLHLEEEK